MVKMIKRIINILKRLFFTPEQYAKHIGIKMGSECSIAKCNWGSEPYLIEIGNHVQITDGVSFFTHGGGWVLRSQYPNFDIFGKIKIGNNVYIGNNAIILPGVIVEDNVIIGAGTVVTKSIASNTIVAGNPARIIGNLDTYLNSKLNYNTNTKGMSNKQKREFIVSLPRQKFIQKKFME